jgi:hypothetical protein
MSSCTYTSAGQDTFTVPPGVTHATFTVEGAQGGTNAIGPGGGRGGKVSATLPLTPGQLLQVNVGGQGQANSAGGGLGSGAGGGGSSDVRTGLFSLVNRVLVAGGGGGAGGSGAAGGSGGEQDPGDVGGGGWGGGGTAGTPRGAGAGHGGTTTTFGGGGTGMNGWSGSAGGTYSGGSGGSLLPVTLPIIGGIGGQGGGAQGGSGETTHGCAGGGGGGGWFGGGGGGATNCAGGGGGGGSNYVCPCAAGGSSATGVQPGSGQVTVTWQAPATMTVAPAAASLSGDALSLSGLTATLTGPNGPLAGQPVTFTAGSAHLCTATTDAAGMATCDASITGEGVSALSVLEWLGYTASYAGDTAYRGSTATGSLVNGECGCMAHVTAFREGGLADARQTAVVPSRKEKVTAAA